ncbi:restriction endonuclease [Romboutsia lituseburensis]|uniref:restriction endonuclease n=1 Tax=Romboutsia lituseburensis TaxID=1537 RepID=UPI00215B5B8C|nr:restriction endonuclease [Romboutsia lituseburensis]MCR8744180.1 restriction endonuclease [Romboutsia lituseburensis]
MSEKQQQREDYINKRYEEAKISTLDIDNRVKDLENIINYKMDNYRIISIEEFIKKDIHTLQLPKALLSKNKEPNKPIIRKANFFEKVLKNHKYHYSLYVDEIESKYNNEYKIYEDKEYKRKKQLENLIKAHELQVNEIINIKKQLYSNGDVSIITGYKEELLTKSKYPFDFKKYITTGYSKETKTLVIDYLLPKDNIVPNVQEYEYIQKGDKIKAKLRKEKDIKSIYNEVIFSIVIRTISEVFNFDKPNNIDNIVFNGYIEDIDLATGQDIKPYIISATINKEKFKYIDVKRINKLKCLKETMQARININSNLELKYINPICKCNHFNKSIVNNDSINLLDVDPYEFEDLVTILFRKMGYNAVTTNKSNDGGIDCEFHYEDPLVSGKIIGQVKKYKNNIDIPKLREFECVLRNSDAMKGIFISTSNFSPQCKIFAASNNIQLINGNELIELFNRHGINSYISKN